MQYCFLVKGGGMVWNSLPSDCKKANGFQSFKMKLKTTLVEQ